MVVVERFLSCDRCGETFGVDSRHLTGDQHRKTAREAGWTHTNRGKDYCSYCSTGGSKSKSINPRVRD